MFKHTYLLLFLLFISTFFLSSAAYSESVAIDDAFSPFMFINDNGQAQGLYVRQIEGIFSKIYRPLNIQGFPWKRALALGKEGSFAVGGIFKNPAREKIYDFSDPVYTKSLYVYVKKNNSFIFNDLKDLKYKNIGVVSGWSYGSKVDAAIKSKLFRTDIAPRTKNNILKLLRGRVDGILMDELTASLIFAQMNIEDQVENLPVPVTSNNVYIAFGKSAKKKALINQINKAIEEMKNEGELRNIYTNFIESLKENNTYE